MSAEKRPRCQICQEKLRWKLCRECVVLGDHDVDTGASKDCHLCHGNRGWWQCPNHHYHDGTEKVTP
jgi:hypothetical protein